MRALTALARASATIVRSRVASLGASRTARRLTAATAASPGRDDSIHNLDAQYDSEPAPYVVVKRVRRDDVGALGDIFLSTGASSVSTTDADLGTENERKSSRATHSRRRPDEVQSRVWDSCDVQAYFPSRDVARGSIEAAEEILGTTLDVTYGSSKSNDWVQVVKDSFTPTKIAEGLYIVPDWCDSVDSSAVNIVLEPGIAFGTGEHPTTRMCLRWLKKTLARRGETELASILGAGRACSPSARS